jgi:hypothetical protein
VHLSSLNSAHVWPDLSETLADEQGAVDEHSVGGAVDLEVPEQDIGAEKREDLVYTVVGLVVDGDLEVGGVGR